MAGLSSMDSILLPYSPKEDHHDIYVDDFFYKILANEYTVKLHFLEIDCLKTSRYSNIQDIEGKILNMCLGLTNHCIQDISVRDNEVKLYILYYSKSKSCIK